MLIKADDSYVVVIDVQTRLLGGIHQSDQLVKTCANVVDLAKLVSVPVLGTEQYPEGLGHSETVLIEKIGTDHIYGKTQFSCASVPAVEAKIRASQRKSLILCGMETQACVIQSALEFKDQGYNVFVVADAVSARNPQESTWALDRMRQLGIHIISFEMLGFEWIADSQHPHFKTFSKTYLR